MSEETITLYRPTGQKEYDLTRRTNFAAFPPRLPEQPFFYPVLNERYATQIARDWNARYNDPKRGYVLRFKVKKSFLDEYEVKTVGGAVHQEYWIPAEQLAAFNQAIVGSIEVVAEFSGG